MDKKKRPFGVITTAPLDSRRAYDVTASDVPAICGENPFQTRRGVLFSKTFRIPFEGNEATEWGKTYEPVAIQKFCEKTGAVIIASSYKKHSIHTWFGGTVDGIVKMPDGRMCVLEVKCPLRRGIKDEVPLHYIGQVQSYMEIYDLNECYFVQYKPAGVRSEEKLMVTLVPRDREYMLLRVPRLLSFWKEMMVLQAQTGRIIVVIQRAWRAYLAKKAVEEAVRGGMVARLRCASILGRIAGYARKKAIQGQDPAYVIEKMGEGGMLVGVGTYPLESGFYGGSSRRKPELKDGEKVYLNI